MQVGNKPIFKNVLRTATLQKPKGIAGVLTPEASRIASWGDTFTRFGQGRKEQAHLVSIPFPSSIWSPAFQTNLLLDGAIGLSAPEVILNAVSQALRECALKQKKMQPDFQQVLDLRAEAALRVLLEPEQSMGKINTALDFMKSFGTERHAALLDPYKNKGHWMEYDTLLKAKSLYVLGDMARYRGVASAKKVLNQLQPFADKWLRAALTLSQKKALQQDLQYFVNVSADLGSEALIKPLIKVWDTSSNPVIQNFVILALSKMMDRGIPIPKAVMTSKLPEFSQRIAKQLKNEDLLPGEKLTWVTLAGKFGDASVCAPLKNLFRYPNSDAKLRREIQDTLQMLTARNIEKAEKTEAALALIPDSKKAVIAKYDPETERLVAIS